jgi:hypothetical protein
MIDNRGDVYVVFRGNRRYADGSTTPPNSGVLAKYRADKGKLPDTSFAMRGRKPWNLTGADWVYPYVGYITGGCPCYAPGDGFAVDRFGRSFVPEHFRGQVGVLDTGGNLIMHIGRYGNVDDGKPLVPNPTRDRAEPPRSIGGDEVAMSYGQFLGVHTDRRLFIYDGNSDVIRSVKLDYHASEAVAVR